MSAKFGSEITVRISVAFLEAPDVHTLLDMTPVRERGKLLKLALARYIAETHHPAGDVEMQIAAVAQSLRDRSGFAPATPFSSQGAEVHQKTDIQQGGNGHGNIADMLQIGRSELPHTNDTRSVPHVNALEPPPTEIDSASVRRWLG